VFLEARYEHHRYNIRANLLNLSIGGLGLLSDRALPVGDIVLVHFCVGDNEIQAPCKVKYSQYDKSRLCYTTGTQFEGLAQGEFESIKRVVDAGLVQRG
jgi:c-di-GMP-binding flagellar brake protein YcgR